VCARGAADVDRFLAESLVSVGIVRPDGHENRIETHNRRFVRAAVT
jgi:hypothetical protein